MSIPPLTRSEKVESPERGTTGTATRLAQDVRLVTATWSARLNVHLNDTYHFDHPLDHVPGMALIGGLLDLVRAAGAGSPELPGKQLVLSLLFPSFCELERPVELRAIEASPANEAEGGTSLSVQVRQANSIVCEGSAAFLPTDPRNEPARSLQTWLEAPYRLPADHALVHRTRPENVLISGVAAAGDSRMVALCPVAGGHQLATYPGGPHRAEVILDAARQFATMIDHLEQARSRDTRLIMLGIDADIPCGLTADVYLRWWPKPARRGRSCFDAEVIAGHPADEPCGAIRFDYHAVSPAAYRRLRPQAVAA